nr:unnamed protein product [Digitaria exilis]
MSDAAAGGGPGDEYKREESVALLVIVSLAALSLLSLIAAFAYYCYITRKVSRRQQSLSLPKRSGSGSPPVPPPRGPPPPHHHHQQQQGKESPSSNSASDGAGGAAMAVVVAGERGVQVFSYRQLHAATGGFGRAHMVGQGSFGAVYRGVLSDGRKVAVKLMDRPGKQGEEEFEMEVELLSRLRSPYLLGLIGHCSEGGHRLLVYEFMANGGLQEHLYPNRDVYSYGVVLLELLTGRVPVDMKRPPGEGVLVNWALPMLTDREKVVRILDPALEGQYSLKDAVQVAAIAAMCVQPEADYRPLMADVVQSLVPLVKNRSTQKACNPNVQASKPLD